MTRKARSEAPSRSPESDPAATDTRTRVLDTAARLFREQGYAATSLRGIAAACELQAASLYHHFSSKDEIVGEVLRLGVERTFEPVRAAVDALPADADAQTLLRTAVRAHLQALLRAHDYTSANVRIFGQVPDAVRAAHLPLRDRYERFWSRLLVRCAQGGVFEPARNLRLVRVFLLGAMNATLDWVDADRAPVQAVADELADTLLFGMLVRPSQGG